jgi:hydrogenase-1 operon protein HyaF
VKPFPLPVVGPGSQPEEESAQFVASPGPMLIFRPPPPREPASREALAGARRVLSQLLAEMEAKAFVAPCLPRLSLLGEAPEVIREVNELLGQGEVACRVAGDRLLRIQETAFASVWRVQELRQDGVVTEDSVETGAFPEAVKQLLLAQPAGAPEVAAPPAGVMNASSLVNEIFDRSAACRPGDAPYVVNLTLLPVTPQDLDYLAATLGQGPVSILSRGYGNCRITATALPRTWWVQYFNSMDQLILNTIEVVDLPQVAQAAREDYEDSRERLAQWIATLDE